MFFFAGVLHHLRFFSRTLHGQPHPSTGSTSIRALSSVDQGEQTNRGIVLDLRTNLMSYTCPGIPRAKTLWTKNAPILGLSCMYRIFCQEYELLYDDCSYPRKMLRIFQGQIGHPYVSDCTETIYQQPCRMQE